jgi:hypothetical protein
LPHPFTFYLFLRPGNAAATAAHPPAIPTDRVLVRVLSISGGRLDRAGAAQEANGSMTVIHPGIAYVPVKNSDENRIEFVRECYHPEYFNPRLPTNAADQGWLAAGSSSRHVMEGYGLFAEWAIEVTASEDNFLADDFFLQFDYYYQRALVPTQNDEVLCVDSDPNGFPVPLPYDLFLSLGDAATARTKLGDWAEKKDGLWPTARYVLSNAPNPVADGLEPTLLANWLKP